MTQLKNGLMLAMLTVLHVSPACNHASIAERGIDPTYHKGGYKSSWLCEKFQLNWALAHCSMRHNVAVSNLEVWTAIIGTDRLIRTKWGGVYRVQGVIVPEVLGVWDITELQAWLKK